MSNAQRPPCGPHLKELTDLNSDAWKALEGQPRITHAVLESLIDDLSRSDFQLIYNNLLAKWEEEQKVCASGFFASFKTFLETKLGLAPLNHEIPAQASSDEIELSYLNQSSRELPQLTTLNTRSISLRIQQITSELQTLLRSASTSAAPILMPINQTESQVEVADSRNCDRNLDQTYKIVVIIGTILIVVIGFLTIYNP